MAPKSVLVSGANGHLGFRVVISALKAGYNVRAIVRRPEAADQIKAAKSVQDYLSSLEVVIIRDLLTEGAFDEAVVGMDAVIHVASPLSRQTEEYFEDVIEPATQMTIGMLKSAAKSKMTKRVVVTSSVVVLNIESNTLIEATDLGPVPNPHASFKSPLEAYVASKRIARAESMKFVYQEMPGFDIINILPSVILGRNELTTSALAMATAGTNRYIVTGINGQPKAATTVSGSIHVNDCAELHVRALDPLIKGNQDFLAHANDVDWSDGSVSEIITKNFKREVENGTLKLKSEIAGLEAKFDAQKTDKMFGIKWLGLEDQVKSVVEQYLELRKEGKS